MRLSFARAALRFRWRCAHDTDLDALMSPHLARSLGLV